jgi:signal transduction histidine kinase
VLLGAILWTTGLMAVWATVITYYADRLSHTRLILIHSHPQMLITVAVVTMIAGFWVVRGALAPLNELRRRLGDVRRGAERRIDGRYPNEVQAVVDDLNNLLSHQERAVGRAIAKAGDLAHGLKTPLALLTQEAERAAAAGQYELSDGIGEQVERMRRQIDYHLAHARAAASGATPGARCAVAESAESLARTLRRLYASRRLAIDVDVPPDHAVRCQREDLDEMLGNLMDNACKWARSNVTVTSAVSLDPPPEGGSYGISEGGGYGKDEGGSYESTASGGASCVITVDDDGPGIDASMRDAVLQRGVRADEAAPGSGFGLAIARELAELYGGTVVLSASPAGGLRAALALPEVGVRS